MSHYDDIRAQLRSPPQPPARSMMAHAMGALTFAAIVSGAVYYLFFMPIKVPLRPSAALPAFHRVDPDGGPQDVQIAPVVREAPPNPSRYAGLSFRATGNLADEVCFARAQARIPHWSKTPRFTTKELSDFTFDEMPHFNELMTCLLTEAPIRYCSSGQRSMIAGEIAMYFRGIEYGNQTLERVKGHIIAARDSGRMESDRASDDLNRLRQRVLVPDPRVIGAIESRLRDGTLTAGDRKTFGAAAPQVTRLRLDGIQQATTLCPRQPLWAFWRSL